MNSVYAAAIDPRPAAEGGLPRLLAGADSEHWGPSVFQSDDFGAPWQETEGGAIRFPTDTGEGLVRTWQLRPAGADQPGRVWAGVEPAALFRLRGRRRDVLAGRGPVAPPAPGTVADAGRGRSVPATRSCPTPPTPTACSSASRRRACTAPTTAASRGRPRTAGSTPGGTPDPHPEFGQCVHKFDGHRDRPDQLFLQNHGGVYRSDDFGATWTAIGESLPADFGFLLAAHPHRAGTAYVYPLVQDAHRMPPEDRCRIYRTTDAGESWQPLADGLPQQQSYVSVLRDALCTDDADPAGVYFGTRPARCSPAPTRGRRGRRSSATCPTCWWSGRPELP